MAEGDHIKVKRPGYWHHGIDVGDGTVVHYCGEVHRKREAEIRRTAMVEFLEGGHLVIVNSGHCFTPEEVVARALCCVGDRGYNLFVNNCEHFAHWCKTGINRSEQVREATAKTGGGTAVGTAAVGSVSVVTGAGAAAGVSGGAGIMAGLASIGPGGVLGGVATLASAPTVAANVAIDAMYADDEAFESHERHARKAARVSAKVGSVAGAAGTVGTISATGTVTGLSGAGITSGLAAIGSVVGGGMAAGVAVSVAAPAVAAAATSFGVYKLWKAFTKKS